MIVSAKQLLPTGPESFRIEKHIDIMLIINADDWGRNKRATENSLDCFNKKRITSVGAMVFMESCERAAELALESGVDVGLHLNLTDRFTGITDSSKLQNYLERISAYLKISKFAKIIYNPFLIKQYEYVFRSQWDEFIRLYHKEPSHINGHKHMHLCMNIILSGMIPKGSCIRRNHSFSPGERHVINRLYRFIIDSFLKINYKSTDYFFGISPISTDRMKHIASLSLENNVELMVHPEIPGEYEYILSSEYHDLTHSLRKGSFMDIISS